MSSPLVSIVIPCFNQGRYLRSAIESCLAQTVTSLEVIVVDDGSTDDTQAIMRALADRDRRVRCLSGPNSGLGAARNRGFREATGRYLNFLDADDWLHPTKLARQCEVLEEDPRVGVVLCDIDTIDEHGRVLSAPPLHLERFTNPDSWFDVLLASGLFPPHVPLVRRELVERAGGFAEDRGIAGHADYLLWLTIAASGARLQILDTPLASYRQTAGSMSRHLEHMTDSRRRALAVLAAGIPERVALGVERLSSLIDDLRVANNLLADLAQTPPPQSQDVDLLRDRAHLHFLERLIAHGDGPLFIWGAGAKGRDVLSLVRKLPRRVTGFVDSSEARLGESINGHEIVSADAALATGSPLIVIASMYHDTIANQLQARGCVKYLVAP